jgi:hypothetical protein
MTSYKVFFYVGEELTLKARAESGIATVDEGALTITSGTTKMVIAADEIEALEVFRYHGIARVIKMQTLHNRVFLAVIRLMIGQFVIARCLRTGKLYRQLLVISGRQATA